MDIPREKLVQNCPIQKKCEWTFKYYSTFNSYKLPVFRCNTCGLETIHTDESIEYEKLYGGEYYKGGSEYTYRDERETEKFDAYVWDARIQNIQKFIKTGNFLDVGCSFGGFLSRAKLKGFQVYGVEVSEYYAEYAKKRGIEVFQGNFLNSNFEKESFDVITLVEVIEHLEKPKEVFQKLSAYLKPGGLLLIQTANFEGKQAIEEGANYHYYLPGHLYYYSLSNLKEILRLNGFKNFKEYYGVDFSLSAKLLKSRGSFKTWKDYLRWFRISYYHYRSSLIKGSTSSMVLYAFKG